MDANIKYEFRSDITFLNIPLTIIYKSEEDSEKEDRILTFDMTGEKLTFPALIEKVLNLFGGAGFEKNFAFEGLSIKDVEVIFNLSKKTVAFRSLVECKELKLDFNFNFWEIIAENGEEGFVFEFVLDEKLSLPGNLPVIKDELKNNVKVVFDKIVVATHEDKKKGIKQGFQFLGKAKVFKAEQPIDIYLFSPAKNQNLQSAYARSANAPKGDAPANNSTKWFNIDKSLGPLGLRKIGFQFEDGMLWALVSVDFLMGPLTFSLEGLKIGSPLKLPPAAEDIEFGLNGVGLSMSEGPIQITGSFLKSASIPDYYSGMAIIQLSEIAIDAFGGYGELANGEKAVFVFVSLDAPLGGPPFFFVKGFSLGFGYNMNFTIPPVKEIPAFPLLNTAIFKDAASPTEALEKLNQYIYPEAGGLWFAVGIKFTTFEVIDTNAMLVVDIGKAQIAILGVAALVLPKVGYAFVNVKLGIVVVVNISEGYFLANARISDDSYVLHPSCKVFGEFAFYTWSKGPHSGDFVFSIGGYHPRFKKPAHYPEVQRVGFNWRVSSLINVGGNCYFTLTPSAVMAGFRFEAIFKANPIKAWFIAIADFLIQWKPFYYDIYVQISIGVKVWAFKFELGVKLWIYGPPVGGLAAVDVGVAEFEIRFGKQKDNKPPLLSWEQFKNNYLPPPSVPKRQSGQKSAAELLDEVCRINVSAGLLKKGKDEAGREVWLVRADEFMASTESVIPAKQLNLAYEREKELVNKSIANPLSSALGVRPIGVSNLYQSNHKVVIQQAEGSEFVNWHARATLNSVPAALWATTPVNKTRPEAETIPAATGFRQITALRWKPPSNITVKTRIANFKYAPVPKELPLKYEMPYIHSQLKDMEADQRSRLITSSILNAQERRSQVIAEVNAFFALDEEDRIEDQLTNLGLDIEENFQSIPRIGHIKSHPKKIGVQKIKLQPLEEPVGLDGKTPVSFKMRQALRQYSNLSLADYTRIQKGLSTSSFRMDEGAIYLFDASQMEQLDKTVRYPGGKTLQLLSFDGLYRLIDCKITAQAIQANVLPDTRQLVAYALPSYDPKFFVCGWTSAYSLPMINNLAFLGEQFVLRTQAPIKMDERGFAKIKTVLAKNIYLGDENQSFRAWVDTQFLNDQIREAIVLVKTKGKQEDLKRKLLLTVPYLAKNDITQLDYEPKAALTISEVHTVNGLSRIRCKISGAKSWKMLAVRVRIPEKYQKHWEIQGVLGLGAQKKLPANAWKNPDLTQMTNNAKTSATKAPVLNIK